MIMEGLPNGYGTSFILKRALDHQDIEKDLALFLYCKSFSNNGLQTKTTPAS